MDCHRFVQLCVAVGGEMKHARLPICLLGLILLFCTACGRATARTPTLVVDGALAAATVTTVAPMTPTPTFEVPPMDLCREYLDLSILHGEIEREAVVTSYRCHSATIDATGQSPLRSPELVVRRGTPITLQLGVEQQPSEIDVRLYPEAGISASFLRWPEELPTQVKAVDRSQPEPATRFQYLAHSVPGPYSLVVQVTWGEGVEVFYAISLALEDAIT